MLFCTDVTRFYIESFAHFLKISYSLGLYRYKMLMFTLCVLHVLYCSGRGCFTLCLFVCFGRQPDQVLTGIENYPYASNITSFSNLCFFCTHTCFMLLWPFLYILLYLYISIVIKNYKLIYK